MRQVACAVLFALTGATVLFAAPAQQPRPLQYLFPRPFSTRVPQETTILIRFATDPRALSNFDSFLTVRGTASGAVQGALSVASDDRTVIYRPAAPFMPGEEVFVRLRPEISGGAGAIDTSYTFQVSPSEALPRAPELEPLSVSSEQAEAGALDRAGEDDPVVMNGVSVPSDFPFMKVLSSNNPAPGYIFLNNWGGQPYNMILDNTGAPIWYRRTPDRRRDFKVQPNGWLTMLVREGYGGGEGYLALDSTYSEVDVMRAANGYRTDEHELTMLPDGHYFMIGVREEQVNMSRYVAGGKPNATVSETVIQEFTPRHEMIFQWRAWDHYDIRDLEIDDLKGDYIRFPHMNALSIDDDGHILVSCRHLSEVTKINRQTGEIIWRLSGRHNQFTFVNDPFNGFKNQHDIRALGNNHYTVFDNGNGHTPPESRAMEYVIDPDKKTATLVWQYRHDPRWYTNWMGNAQRLPNGNTQINYADASLPKVVEVRPDGEIALEMDFVDPAHTYRAFKFDWRGKATVPYLLLENYPTRLTLLFNKFGDPDVDHYNIYGGVRPNPTELMGTSQDPFLHLTGLENEKRYYFRVTAVNAAGEESGYSNEESAVVKMIAPGANMVLNGSFSEGLDNWTFETSGGAQAVALTFPGQTLRFAITSGGSELFHIQFRQGGMPLVKGRSYRFEFDAYADQPRLFEAKITKDGAPWTNYGKIGLTSLTAQSKHFTYDFTMEDPTDFAARVVLNAGTANADVYVDNLSLKELPASTSAEEEAPASRTHAPPVSFPNPFHREARIRYELPEAGPVVLRVFNVLGQQVRVLVEERQGPGPHTAIFDASGLPAGVYYYELEAGDASGKQRRVAAGKMVYVR